MPPTPKCYLHLVPGKRKSNLLQWYAPCTKAAGQHKTDSLFFVCLVCFGVYVCVFCFVGRALVCFLLVLCIIDFCLFWVSFLLFLVSFCFGESEKKMFSKWLNLCIIVLKELARYCFSIFYIVIWWSVVLISGGEMPLILMGILHELE